MKFDAGDVECKNCRFDVEMVVSNPKFYEYKSYTDASKISIDQFNSYIGSINNLSELKYVFNASKLSVPQAKVGMKTFFVKNYDSIWTG